MKRTIFLALLVLIAGCTNAQTGQQISTTPELRLLKLPNGFHINLFASALDNPRMMAVSPDGRLFVTETAAGRVTILPDTNGNGEAESHITYASGLDRPHGIAFHGGYLYVAESGQVVRYKYQNGASSAPTPEIIITGIPSTGEHFTRTLTFGPDGGLYLSVGSSCNACIERSPLRAAILHFDADGKNRTIYASGLRNAVGMAWQPGTGLLWATENGRDFLGDNLPPDEVNIIRQGGFYGWPYAYGNRVPDPQFGKQAPAKVQISIPPTIAIQAHSAPLGLTFYTGTNFPQNYSGNLFVAYHGSWNRSVPTGYKVVRYTVQGERVTGGPYDFISGWLQDGKAWGRPVGLTVGRYGELYVTDDAGGHVYRVIYKK